MAIDRNKTKQLLQSIDGLFDTILPENISKETKDYIFEKVFGPAKGEIEKLINESRPPKLFLMGRSGHGKSSLINALAGKKIAETTPVKPGTKETIPLNVQFDEGKYSWTFYDSRGYFETVKSTSDNYDEVKHLLKKSIVETNPDVIMHVIDIQSVRALKNDLELYNEIAQELKNETGSSAPTIIVLNHADLLGDPEQWPPENNAHKAAMINDSINYMVNDILNTKNYNSINLNNSLYGVALPESECYLAVIPTCALWEKDFDERWNIETLIDYIGDKLPREALLEFCQASKRKHLLTKMADELTKSFAKTATVVGVNPIPFADIYVLSSLQILLVTVIAGLSCRDVNKDNYESIIVELGSALGLVIVGGRGLRTLSRVLLEALAPGGVYVQASVSGTIAGAGTYAIGKAAEAYFFNNEIFDLWKLFETAKNFFTIKTDKSNE